MSCVTQEIYSEQSWLQDEKEEEEEELSSGF